MNWIIPHTVDLAKPAPAISDPYTLMFPGDENAHVWQITVLNNGEAADLSGGTATGYFLRPDGNTVTIVGTISNNVISVTLDATVYAYVGWVKAAVRWSVSGNTVTLDLRLFEIKPQIDSGSYIDPGEVIPSIAELLAAIEDMEDATEAAEAAATKSVRYDTAQSLTSTQKAQALANLGLTAVDDGEGNITFS